MSDLTTCPAIVAEAERLAEGLWSAWPTPQRAATWADEVAEWRNRLIAAHLALLCDLSRPASRDAIARLVAPRIDWNAWEVIEAVDSNWPKLVALHRRVGLPEPERWEPHPPAAEALATVARRVLGGEE